MRYFAMVLCSEDTLGCFGRCIGVGRTMRVFKVMLFTDFLRGRLHGSFEVQYGPTKKSIHFKHTIYPRRRVVGPLGFGVAPVLEPIAIFSGFSPISAACEAVAGAFQ